ncbi:alpha/beta fold hydrolase, partial [Streptomyces sp. NPDC054838]
SRRAARRALRRIRRRHPTVASGRRHRCTAVAAALLCSTGSARLVAEALVLPVRAGRARTRITGAILGSRAPLGPVTPLGKRVLRYATMGPDSTPEQVEACARIVHGCPTGVRYAWSQVLAGLDLEANLAALTVPTAVIGGTEDRLTPIPHSRALAAALPDCAGLTELPGKGHMTPIEAPEAVTRVIRELAARLPAPHRPVTNPKEKTP